MRSEQPVPPARERHGAASMSGPAPSVTVIIARRTLLLIATLLIAAWLFPRLAHVLTVLSGAVLLATAVDQPVSWLNRHRIPRGIAVLAIYALLLVILGGVVAVLVPLVGGELVLLEQRLPDDIRHLERIIHRVAPSVSGVSDVSLAPLATELSRHAGTIAGRLTSVTLTAGSTLVLIAATFVVAYFLAADAAVGPHLIQRYVPIPAQARVASVASGIHERIGAWARGQALIAVSFGVAMGIGLKLLGVPYAISLGLIAAVLELIPYVGGAVTLVLAMLVALTVGVPQVIGVLILYLVLVNLEAHVLAPVLLGHALGLPSVAILVALLIGVELLGVIGALLAVPATVVLWAVVEEVWPPPEQVPL